MQQPNLTKFNLNKIMEKKVHTEKVKESERSKKLSTLETIEEVQKDIQLIFSNAKKTVIRIKDDDVAKQANHILSGIQFNVNETKDISRMVYSQIMKFWHNAYSLNEQIINLSTK